MSKDANLPHREFGIFDETTVFKRLMKRRDIVSLTIIYEDGKEVTYYGPYDENECIIGNLATVRKGGKEVLKISTRLERLTQHKEDFQKGNSSLAFAREYIDVDNPFAILQYFPLYIDSLKRELMRDYKQLLTHDLEIQDNAYGGDYHKYTTLVKKGYGTNYHPNLGSINFSHEIPVQYFSDLMMELEKLSIIKPIEKERLPYASAYFDPFYDFSDLDDILEYKIKTEEYDYTKLLKLLNFPKEIYVCTIYGKEVGMYKLIKDSYVFHKLNVCNQWYNVLDNYKEFLEKR